MPKYNFQNRLVSKQLTNAENSAREYFSSKPRQKKYLFTGCDCTDGELLGECGHFFAYTDEEMARVKELIVSTYNKAFGQHAQTVEEIMREDKDFEIGELEGECEELDRLVFDRCDDVQMFPKEIDFDQVHYFYTMSFISYDAVHNKVRPAQKFKIDLYDEEYIYLLKMSACHRSYFTFNSLVGENPLLAKKIISAVQNLFDGTTYANDKPFLVVMDEVLEDVEKFMGPESQNYQIYESYFEDGMYHVCAYTEKHVLVVYKETAHQQRITSEYASAIDADKVMELLGCSNYKTMLEKLAEDFGTQDAYERILDFLYEHDIPYCIITG